MPWIYEGMGDLVNGFIRVVLSNKTGHVLGYVNHEGKLITPVKYDSGEDFSEGMAAVQINKKWGFIDETGTEVISLQYYMVSKFKDGYATVYETSGGPAIKLKKPIPTIK